MLEFFVVWPNVLTNMELLHKKWLNTNGPEMIKSYHPRVQAFEDALKKIRRKKGDAVISTTKLPLPFPVETHIFEKHNLGWKDCTSKVIFIELKAAIDTYGLKNDEQEFEYV